MKRVSIFTTVLIAFFAAGCHGQNSGKPHESGEAEISYSEKSGLSIPDQTAQYIGLKIAEVDESKIKAEIKFTAQVYETSVQSQALASGVVGSAEAASFRAGQKVSVEWSDNTMAARIKELNRQLEKASGQVEILVEIDDADKKLPQSGFVSVSAPIAPSENGAITVPRTALLRTVEGDFIYTVSGHSYVRAPVKIGIINDDFVEVLDGLYAGDQIVTTPVMTLWMAELQFLRGGKSCADGH